jgi:hypothetical protein
LDFSIARVSSYKSRLLSVIGRAFELADLTIQQKAKEQK